MAKRTPRPYQNDVINEYWMCLHAGYKAPVIVMPTGAGKTFVFTYIVEQMLEQGHTILVCCHRAELIRQITSSLATQGIMHDMICSDKTRAICGNVQQKEFGRTFYQPGAQVVVASVQTINSRLKEREKMTPKAMQLRKMTQAMMQRFTFSVFDEAHHLLKDNTFGAPLKHVTDTHLSLLVTATPERADGQGMGCAALGGNGIADVMILGPEMRQLIDWGNLCDYEIFEPPTEQADFDKVRISKSGDLNTEDQAREMNKAQITGDVVRHYQELIYGKLTIVFCCDIAHATSVAEAYMAAGIPAAVLHGGDDEYTRFKTINAFERREIWVLVTVDLVSEGFDLPAIEAAQFLRRTLSLGWFMQAFGRVLRPAPGKAIATILDHVGNWRIHGLPDKPRVWSLANRSGGKKGDEDPDSVPVTTCRALVGKREYFTPEAIAAMDKQQQQDNHIRPCTYIYEITKPCCPKCGQRQPLSPRGEPVLVKGELVKVPLEELERMRAGSAISDQAAIWRQEVQPQMLMLNMTPERYVAAYMNVPAKYQEPHLVNHRRWRAFQHTLRPLMDEWMDYHKKDNISQEAAQELFLKRFGTNVYYAQVLKPKECEVLINQIQAHLEAIHQKGGLTYV